APGGLPGPGVWAMPPRPSGGGASYCRTHSDPSIWPIMSLDLEALQAFPKVSLHDHLDGGLRPQTIIELAADIGHPLPADNADDLGQWFAESANLGSLECYLETFDHTIAVMQTASNLRRVAREFVEDLAA